MSGRENSPGWAVPAAPTPAPVVSQVACPGAGWRPLWKHPVLVHIGSWKKAASAMGDDFPCFCCWWEAHPCTEIWGVIMYGDFQCFQTPSCNFIRLRWLVVFFPGTGFHCSSISSGNLVTHTQKHTDTFKVLEWIQRMKLEGSRG